MTEPDADERFRAAAEAEGGAPVSAGARVSHLEMALAAGRTVRVDLAGVPAERRAAVIGEIAALVREAGGQVHGAGVP